MLAAHWSILLEILINIIIIIVCLHLHIRLIILLKFIEHWILSNLTNYFVLFIYHIKSIQLTIQVIIPCIFIGKIWFLFFWFFFILAEETLFVWA